MSDDALVTAAKKNLDALIPPSARLASDEKFDAAEALWITKRMGKEIETGSFTAEELEGLDEEAGAVRYGASRHTFRDARKKALAR